ncbi:MAG: 4-hydroxythreonine-4-phosphate dehydrogenase PdxA [Geobacter sp.]|nr:4-hydroxythreonine-4-phosphate dehydrogenase PdxA [Geobacter sp.]
MNRPIIAVTMGDPAGIGPEIVAKALAGSDVQTCCRPLVVGDRNAMERGIRDSGVRLQVEETDDLPGEDERTGVLYLRTCSRLADDDIVYGKPSTTAGDAVYRYIVEAATLCSSGRVAGMATAPISKVAMNRAGHHYPGHTELLAHLTNSSECVMMLAGDRLRVSLVTIHEPLAAVPGLLTVDKVLSTIRTTSRDLARYFIPSPRIGVAALNPHCGEEGLFGNEEQRIIAPAIALARSEGIEVQGPLSADTLFHFAIDGGYDAVVCMYHDQGLIPLKLVHFDDGVNVTLGLPIIRTSVDHGTAYDLAGSGTASATSMTAAIRMAASMARQAQAAVSGP